MSELTRRDAIKMLATVGAGAAVGCRAAGSEPLSPNANANTNVHTHAPEGDISAEVAEVAEGGSPILSAEPLAFLWRTHDPFLFCAHHDDRFPAGNAEFGPSVSLAGRNLGSDFELRDGFRMYHGRVVPGFPKHPHRGFETVTVVRRGLLDHSDSMGAAARYGGGDVQWLTAGRGIQHAEMFPLLRSADENPLELFQIWLNLPRANKMVEPHFTMLWAEGIQHVTLRDAEDRATEVAVIAGRFADADAPAPPPNSWASAQENDVAIWTVKLEPHAHFTLPPAGRSTRRSIYLHQGAGMRAGREHLPPRHQFELHSAAPLALQNGPEASEFLLLQGRPIGEPVARQGPFVMNTRQEVMRAFSDYRATEFGGWPWRRDDPVHGAEATRFARHADGREERPA